MLPHKTIIGSAAQTCQDFGCCFKDLTSFDCQFATLNTEDVDCSDKPTICHK